MDKIIESKHFYCEICRALVLKIVFAPRCWTETELNDVAISAETDQESGDHEVWVIGDTMDLSDEDAEHPSWKRKPFSKKLEYIRPSDFNKRIVNAEESHCK